MNNSGLMANEPSERLEEVIPFGMSPYLEILQALSRGCGIEVDPFAALTSLRQVEKDYPGSWSTVWSQRLVEAGRDLGLRISVSHLTLKEALGRSRFDRAVATLIPDDNENLVPVILLGSQGWRAVTQKIDKPGTHLVRVSELQKQFQQQSINSTGSTMWLTADPLTPFQPLTQQLEEEHHEHHGPSPWSRLMQMLRKDRNDLWVIFLFSLGIGIFSLSVPITVEAIVTTVQGGTSILLQPVIVLAIALFAFLALAAFLRVMKAFVVEYLQQRIFVRVTADLAWRLPRTQVESFDRHHGPELANRFFDVLTVQKASAVLLTEGLSVALQTTLGLMVLAFYNPYLLGFDILLLGAIGFIIFVLGRGGVRTSIKESYAKYKVAGWLEEMLRHPSAFKMSGAPALALERADQLARGYVDARRSHFRIVFRQILFILLLQAVASAVLLGLGGWLVINRGLTLGQLVAAELIVTMIVGSFVKFGKSLESYYDLMAGVDKLGHLVDLPLEPTGGEAHRPVNGAEPASLRLHQVSFEYPEEHHRVLNNLSLEIKAGERVAVLGSHGSGKTTLVELIYALREPQSGYIALDGVNIRDLKPESLRAHVATAKGLEVFEGSVIDNVRMGRHFISLADIREALQRAHLLDEVQALPQGLHTQLSIGGNPLSFGQARRLMLARAMAGRPRLLLIDEAFDYVHEDVREHLLRNVLDRNAPWTALVITHSPEIAEHCDRVIQLSHGSALDQGPDAATDKTSDRDRD